MPKSLRGRPRRSVVLITSIAYSLANFRGPLIRKLIEQGFHVYALAPDYDEHTHATTSALGAEPVEFTLERTGMRIHADLIATWRLTRILRRLSPDYMLCYFIKPVIYGGFAGWLARVPSRYALVAGLGYVYTENGNERSLKRRIVRSVTSLLYRAAFLTYRRVFFQNQDDVNQFVQAGLIGRGRVKRLNGTGVDLKVLRLHPAPSKPVTFLLMARLLREKGIFEYIEAARTVGRRDPSARFILLGGIDPNPGGIDVATVRRWADEGVVEWPGHVNDVQPWLEQASVYVLPSYREGMPRSTQEALALGRPVITTDVPGCRETVIDGTNGFLIPAREVGPLVEAMERFLVDPDLISVMGTASRALAEHRFDVDKINRVMLETMDILSPRHTADPGASEADAMSRTGAQSDAVR